MNALETAPQTSEPAPATATRRRFLDWSELQAWQVGCAITAVVIGLVMLFYAEENWRGRRAWNQCKKELEARGQTLDWAAYMPARVPDEQNFFAAPRMTEWFVGRGANSLSKSIDYGDFQTFLRQHGNSPVAEVTILTNHEMVAPEAADIILQYEMKTLSLSSCQHRQGLPGECARHSEPHQGTGGGERGPPAVAGRRAGAL